MGEHRAPERRLALHARSHLRLVHSGATAPRMRKLTAADLLPLDDYLREREAFRQRVLAHRARRQARLDSQVLLLFEDRLTVLWQVQEALRIERVFEPHAIEAELEAWNSLLPDGGNLKATMLVEPGDAGAHEHALARLGGIERRVHAGVAGFEPIPAQADAPEGLPSGEVGVFFLRFEFPPAQRLALHAGAALGLGIDDDRLRVGLVLPEDTRTALLADFG